jgi:adenylate cyclase
MTATPPQKRKLAAVMFTDIAGYSALAHRDEELAFELLEEHRALVRPLLKQHLGREIRTIGDGFFLEFESAVDAVEFALELQSGLATRNRTAPRERRVLIRIGIHLGDVIDAGDDLHGDGVNIAARLQAVAKPGGICFSGQVYDQVHNKIDAAIVFHGARTLKNIRKPVKVFRIDLGIESSLSAASRRQGRRHTMARFVRRLSATLLASRSRRIATFSTSALAAGLIVLVSQLQLSGHLQHPRTPERLAVVPFTDLSRQPDDEYLADGLTEELISHLSSIPELRVLGRSTTAALADGRKPLPEIARELGVARLITGTVRRSGHELRVTVQLADAATQENLWSEEFDSKVEDIFATQKRIAARVAARMLPSARGPASARDPERAETTEPLPRNEAYVAYLKGRYFLNRRTEPDLVRGISYFERAVSRDPRLVQAHVGIANGYGLLGYYGFLSPNEALRRGRASSEKALELDPLSAEAFTVRATRQLYYEHDFAAAERDFRRAVELAPGYATGKQWYGEFLLARARFAEAREWIERALESDPLSLPTLTARGLTDYYEGKLGRAVTRYQAALELDPGFVPAYLWLGRAYLAARRPQEAIPVLEKGMKLSGGAPLLTSVLAQAYAAAGDGERARQSLRRLNAQATARYVSSYDLASLHLALGERDQALALLEKCFDEKAYYLVFLRVDPLLAPLRGDPRFEALASRL